MALELTGRLYDKQNTQQITATFSKREFTIEVVEQAANGMTYTNYASFQLANNQCTLIDNFNIGDNITVSFNVRGNRWEKDGQVRFITNLNAWKIQAVGSQQQQPQAQAQPTFAPQPSAQTFSNSVEPANDDLLF